MLATLIGLSVPMFEPSSLIRRFRRRMPKQQQGGQRIRAWTSIPPMPHQHQQIDSVVVLVTSALYSFWLSRTIVSLSWQ